MGETTEQPDVGPAGLLLAAEALSDLAGALRECAAAGMGYVPARPGAGPLGWAGWASHTAEVARLELALEEEAKHG